MSKNSKKLSMILIVITIVVSVFNFNFFIDSVHPLFRVLPIIVSIVIVTVGIVLAIMDSQFRSSIAVTILMGVFVFNSFGVAYASYNLVEDVNNPVSFVGLNVVEAFDTSKQNDVELEIEYAYSDTTETGYVMAEFKDSIFNPNKVTLLVSEGADYNKEVILPDFSGMTVDDFLIFAEENHLKNVKTSFKVSDQKRDVAINQSLKGVIKRNDELKVEFSFGLEEPNAAIKVESFENYSLLRSEVSFQRYNISYAIEEDFSDIVPVGKVIDSNQEVGIEIDPTTEGIKILISKGKAVVIPDFTEFTIDQLKEWALENGVTLSIIDAFHNDLETGEIISISVNKDDKISSNTTINVTVSKGQLVMINSENYNDIEKFLKENEREYTLEYDFSTTVAEDSIISISHKPGDVILVEDDVRIVVSKGKSAKVPNFIGLTEKSAIKLCKDSGFTCNIISGGYSSTAKGLVNKQSIKAGNDVLEGINITISISQGPRPAGGGSTGGSNPGGGNNGGNKPGGGGGGDPQPPACDSSFSKYVGIQDDWILNQGGSAGSKRTLERMLKQERPNVRWKVILKESNEGVPGGLHETSPFKGGVVRDCDEIIIYLNE